MTFSETKEQVNSLSEKECRSLVLFLTLCLRNMVEPLPLLVPLSAEHVRPPSDELFERLGLREFRTKMFAYGTVHDWDEEYNDRPIVELRYLDGSVERVDVLESVRTNASSIGHPAILLAIKRWEQMIILRRSRPSGELYKCAMRHLEKVGKALLDGARDRSLKSAEAYELSKMLLTSCHESLTKVWKILHGETVTKARIKLAAVEKLFFDKERWAEIQELFDADEPEGLEAHIQKKWDEIEEFFECTPGRQFLSNPPSLATFLRAFDMWQLVLSSSSVRTYRSRLGRESRALKAFLNAVETGALDPAKDPGHSCLSNGAYWLRLPLKSQRISSSFRVPLPTHFEICSTRSVD